MPEPLLIVDIQCGFINQFTHHIPQRVARLIQKDEYAPLLFTRFLNSTDSPYQRLLDWHSCSDKPEINIVPELKPFAKSEFIFSKAGLCGMPDELCNYLNSEANSSKDRN